MDRLKRTTIIGTIFVLITGTLSHFIYEWSGSNPLAALFFPVNESTWEHMKLIFFPTLLYGFYMQHTLKAEYPCISNAIPAGILAGTILIPVLFYSYTGILGFNTMILDISVFIVAVLITFYLIFVLTRSCKLSSSKWLYIPVMVMIAAFMIFSFTPPDLGIFLDPLAGK